LKIPFKRKSARYNENEAADINKENFQSNETGESNISNPEKKSKYSKSSLSVDESNNSTPIKSRSNWQVCSACKNLISGEIKRPEWRWNMDTSQPMCIDCYERKFEEFEKINNYCNVCNKKLGFIRYNPKPLWAIKGQLCRSCWDSKNSTFTK